MAHMPGIEHAAHVFVVLDKGVAFIDQEGWNATELAVLIDGSEEARRTDAAHDLRPRREPIDHGK